MLPPSPPGQIVFRMGPFPASTHRSFTQSASCATMYGQPGMHQTPRPPPWANPMTHPLSPFSQVSTPTAEPTATAQKRLSTASNRLPGPVRTAHDTPALGHVFSKCKPPPPPPLSCAAPFAAQRNRRGLCATMTNGGTSQVRMMEHPPTALSLYASSVVL